MKKLITLVLAALMVFSLAACSTDASSTAPSSAPGDSSAPSAAGSTGGGEGTIGVLLPSLAFDFQAQMAAGVRRAADENGYGYQEVDYNFDAELQLSGAETLAAAGVGAYYGIFMNAESANATFEQYPAIGTISQSRDVNATAFMANDYVDMGNQFVDAVDYFRTENGIEGGQMAAIWLTTCEVVDSDFYNAMVDIKTIMDGYCEEFGIEFVSDQYADTDEEVSNIAEQLLNAYPDLRYVFCFNNGFAIVVANEISAAQQDTSEYFVFSSEGDAESFRLISSGTSPYRACAYNDIEQSGYEAGLQLINWIENGTMEDVVVTRQLVDVRNVDEYLT